MPSKQSVSTRSTTPSSTIESPSIDAVLLALSDRRIRRVLYCLHAYDGVAFCEDLLFSLTTHEEADSATLASDLRHRILPELVMLGAVEHEQATGLVIDRGEPLLIEALELIQTWEQIG